MYNNTNKLVQPQGYGRIVQNNYLYEGLFSPDLPGRLIADKSANITEIKSEIFAFVVKTATYNQLSNLYIQIPSSGNEVLQKKIS